ncbi:MAG TPA: DUF533 domain-containing protein [Vicinamibacteria bacterium]|nr:DUF533 domain-containing protein [Vicinamibacteria bacterium]
MLEAGDILDGLVRGALGSSGKTWERAGHAVRHGGLINARTLLAAAGVAWGLYETWQSQQAPVAAAPHGSASAGGSPPAGPLAAPPRPGAISPAGEAGLPRPVLQLLRLMISAARADGELGPAERARILAEAREVGAEALVLRELDSPRPLGEIVAGVTDPQLKEQLYTLAFTIVRADEAVTGSERIYLAQLAHRLGLDPTAVARLEAEAARHIDAAGAPSPPIG